jgi:nicotinate phosphoribosyltransferase
MRGGKRVAPPSPLARLRERAIAELARLPKSLQQLEEGKTVPVIISPALRNLARSIDLRQQNHI